MLCSKLDTETTRSVAPATQGHNATLQQNELDNVTVMSAWGNEDDNTLTPKINDL